MGNFLIITCYRERRGGKVSYFDLWPFRVYTLLHVLFQEHEVKCRPSHNNNEVHIATMEKHISYPLSAHHADNCRTNWYSIQTLCLIGAWHVLTDANVTWSVNNIPQLLLMCTSTLKKNIWIYLILLCTPLPHDWSNSINSLFPNTELFLVQLKYFIYTGLHN